MKQSKEKEQKQQKERERKQQAEKKQTPLRSFGEVLDLLNGKRLK